MARLMPAETSGVRIFGQNVGSVVVSEVFDAPLPDELLCGFEN